VAFIYPGQKETGRPVEMAQLLNVGSQSSNTPDDEYIVKKLKIKISRDYIIIYQHC